MQGMGSKNQRSVSDLGACLWGLFLGLKHHAKLAHIQSILRLICFVRFYSLSCLRIINLKIRSKRNIVGYLRLNNSFHYKKSSATRFYHQTNGLWQNRHFVNDITKRLRATILYGERGICWIYRLISSPIPCNYPLLYFLLRERISQSSGRKYLRKDAGTNSYNSALLYSPENIYGCLYYSNLLLH